MRCRSRSCSSDIDVERIVALHLVSSSCQWRKRRSQFGRTGWVTFSSASSGCWLPPDGCALVGGGGVDGLEGAVAVVEGAGVVVVGLGSPPLCSQNTTDTYSSPFSPTAWPVPIADHLGLVMIPQ